MQLDWYVASLYIHPNKISKTKVIASYSNNLVPRVLSFPPSRKEERGPWERGCYSNWFSPIPTRLYRSRQNRIIRARFSRQLWFEAEVPHVVTNKSWSQKKKRGKSIEMEETRLTSKYISQPDSVPIWRLLAVLKIDINSFKIEQSRFLQCSVLSIRVHFATENGRFFVMADFCNKLNSCRICKWKWRFLSRKRSERLFKISKVSLIQFYSRCVRFHCISTPGVSTV